LHLVGVPYLPAYIDDARSNTNQVYCISEAYRRKALKHKVLRIFGLKTDEVAEEWTEFNNGKA
jgi:hypothetical protein